MGIGLKLVNSVEEWLLKNGAEYTFFATEKNNTASINLFTLKCNYVNLSSLVIFAQSICFPSQNLPQDIKIEKLHIDHAISLYKKRLSSDKEIYPADIEAILKGKLSLGTWVCYFKKEGWVDFHSKEKNEDITKISSSWMMFSIWNTCEAYKLQIRKSHPLRSFHATLSQAREKISLCLKRPNSDDDDTFPKSIGFLFLYGLIGEGEKVGELMKSVWSFASKLCQNVKDCKVIVTELGVTDPLIKHVPQESSMSCINDLWYTKKMMFHDDDDMMGLMLAKGSLGNVFVDPRDF